MVDFVSVYVQCIIVFKFYFTCLLILAMDIVSHVLSLGYGHIIFELLFRYLIYLS